jgi:hypothetical protein
VANLLPQHLFESAWFNNQSHLVAKQENITGEKQGSGNLADKASHSRCVGFFYMPGLNPQQNIPWVQWQERYSLGHRGHRTIITAFISTAVTNEATILCVMLVAACSGAQFPRDRRTPMSATWRQLLWKTWRDVNRQIDITLRHHKRQDYDALSEQVCWLQTRIKTTQKRSL